MINYLIRHEGLSTYKLAFQTRTTSTIHAIPKPATEPLQSIVAFKQHQIITNMHVFHRTYATSWKLFIPKIQHPNHYPDNIYTSPEPCAPSQPQSAKPSNSALPHADTRLPLHNAPFPYLSIFVTCIHRIRHWQ